MKWNNLGLCWAEKVPVGRLPRESSTLCCWCCDRPRLLTAEWDWDIMPLFTQIIRHDDFLLFESTMKSNSTALQWKKIWRHILKNKLTLKYEFSTYPTDCEIESLVSHCRLLQIVGIVFLYWWVIAKLHALIWEILDRVTPTQPSQNVVPIKHLRYKICWRLNSILVLLQVI